MREAAVLFAAGLVASCGTLEAAPESTTVLLADLAAKGDESTPERAVSAYRALKGMGTRASPELVKGVDDRRNAWPCFQEQTRGKTTVGDVCFSIIRFHVEGPVPKSCRQWCVLSKVAVPDWWRLRSGRTLRELQIEAASLSIARVRADRSVTEDQRRMAIEYWTSRLGVLETDDERQGQ